MGYRGEEENKEGGKELHYHIYIYIYIVRYSTHLVCNFFLYLGVLKLFLSKLKSTTNQKELHIKKLIA